MQNNTNQLWTVTEVASALNLGASTVWRKVKDGSFPSPIKIGGSTRWHRSEVEALITSLTDQQRGKNGRAAQ